MEENAIKIAILETRLDALTKQQEKLVQKIEDLTEIMNKGKGAFAVAMFLSGTGGGVLVTIFTYIFRAFYHGQ